MPRKPDFFSQLDRDELEKLEAAAREPDASVDSLHVWLLVRGYTASRSAVGRWAKRFNEQDGFSVAADIVDAVYTANAENGNVDLLKAATLQLNQRMVNLLANNKAQDPATMLEFARAIESLARSSRHGVKYETELKEQKAKEAAALKAGEEAVKTGATADEALDAVRRMLGVGA